MVSIGVASLFQVVYVGLHGRLVSLLVWKYASTYSSGSFPAVTLSARYLLNAVKRQIVYESAIRTRGRQRRGRLSKSILSVVYHLHL